MKRIPNLISLILSFLKIDRNLTFVIVEGNSRLLGECVVTPISIEPVHFVTILSRRTSKTSFGFNGRFVRTTPKLKSSVAFGLCAERPLLITAACEPQLGWNSSRLSTKWGARTGWMFAWKRFGFRKFSNNDRIQVYFKHVHSDVTILYLHLRFVVWVGILVFS